MSCKKVIPFKDINRFINKRHNIRDHGNNSRNDIRKNPFFLKKEIPYHYRVFTVLYCKSSFMSHPVTNKVCGQICTLPDLGAVLSDSNIKHLRDYCYYRCRKPDTLMSISKNKNPPLFYLLTDKKKRR